MFARLGKGVLQRLGLCICNCMGKGVVKELGGVLGGLRKDGGGGDIGKSDLLSLFQGRVSADEFIPLV